MKVKVATVQMTTDDRDKARVDTVLFTVRPRVREPGVHRGLGQDAHEPASGIGFVGRGAVVDPWGEVVATAPDRECVTVTTIDSTRSRRRSTATRSCTSAGRRCTGSSTRAPEPSDASLRPRPPA